MQFNGQKSDMELQDMRDLINRMTQRLQAFEEYITSRYGEEVVSEFNQQYDRSSRSNNVINLMPTQQYVTVQLNQSNDANGQTFTTEQGGKQFEFHLQDTDLIFPITYTTSSINTVNISNADRAQISQDPIPKHRIVKSVSLSNSGDQIRISKPLSSTARATPSKVIPIQISNKQTDQRFQSEERKFQCSECEKNYKKRAHLNQHIKLVHTDDKKFKCVRCEKPFAQNAMLISHLKRCNFTNKRYGCDFCPKKFHSIAELTKHRRTHTGEKPYECTICGRRFAIISNLTGHIKTHSGIKEAYCEICGRGFSRKKVLENHMKVHLMADAPPPVKSFHCKACPQTFEKQYHLTVHWDKQHKIKYNFTPEELESIELPPRSKKERKKASTENLNIDTEIEEIQIN